MTGLGSLSGGLRTMVPPALVLEERVGRLVRGVFRIGIISILKMEAREGSQSLDADDGLV